MIHTCGAHLSVPPHTHTLPWFLWSCGRNEAARCVFDIPVWISALQAAADMTEHRSDPPPSFRLRHVRLTVAHRRHSCSCCAQVHECCQLHILTASAHMRKCASTAALCVAVCARWTGACSPSWKFLYLQSNKSKCQKAAVPVTSTRGSIDFYVYLLNIRAEVDMFTAS